MFPGMQCEILSGVAFGLDEAQPVCLILKFVRSYLQIRLVTCFQCKWDLIHEYTFIERTGLVFYIEFLLVRLKHETTLL